MIRVLVIAGSTATRAGLEALVSASPALTLAGSSRDDVATLPELVEELRPDVVLVEFEPADQESLLASLQLIMGDGPVPGAPPNSAPGDLGPHPADTGEDTELARPRFPAVVVLANDAHGAWAREALRSGARAVLPRNATAAQIATAIEVVAAGLVVMDHEVANTLLAAMPTAPRVLPHNRGQTLTPRETKVLGMLAEGLGNKEIAWRLKISEHTVKFHISSIFTKLDVSSRTEAVTLGIRLGLVML